MGFPQVPAESFVVTARGGSGGAQRPVALAAPLSFLSVTLDLPLSG